MKIIRISTDLELTVHDFPDGAYAQQHKELCELIGNYCDIYESVEPRRLYTELNMQNEPVTTDGECVCMLVDEEGLLKENEPNLVGSYLYETDKHQHPIVGNIVFAGKKWINGGIDFCGIEESVFPLLEQQLINLIQHMNAAKEELGK